VIKATKNTVSGLVTVTMRQETADTLAARLGEITSYVGDEFVLAIEALGPETYDSPNVTADVASASHDVSVTKLDPTFVTLHRHARHGENLSPDTARKLACALFGAANVAQKNRSRG
jgi:hypothetical protein